MDNIQGKLQTQTEVYLPRIAFLESSFYQIRNVIFLGFQIGWSTFRHFHSLSEVASREFTNRDQHVRPLLIGVLLQIGCLF